MVNSYNISTIFLNILVNFKELQKYIINSLKYLVMLYVVFSD